MSPDLYTSWRERVKGSKVFSYQPSAFSENKTPRTFFPQHSVLSLLLFLWRSRSGHADQYCRASPDGRDLLRSYLRFRRDARDDQVAYIRGTVVDSHLDLSLHFQPELFEDTTRINDDTRTVAQALVPIRRYAEDRAWIARTECADHDIMQLLGILDRHKSIE